MEYNGGARIPFAEKVEKWRGAFNEILCKRQARNVDERMGDINKQIYCKIRERGCETNAGARNPEERNKNTKRRHGVSEIIRNINSRRRFNKFIIELVDHSLPWLARSTRKIISREARTPAQSCRGVAKQIHVLAISRPQRLGPPQALAQVSQLN